MDDSVDEFHLNAVYGEEFGDLFLALFFGYKAVVVCVVNFTDIAIRLKNRPLRPQFGCVCATVCGLHIKKHVVWDSKSLTKNTHATAFPVMG